jgi:hypothetical protein
LPPPLAPEDFDVSDRENGCLRPGEDVRLSLAFAAAGEGGLAAFLAHGRLIALALVTPAL